MHAQIKRLRNARFLNSVGILLSGTAAAQMLAVLVLPVLTRLYTPNDFAVFAVFASMLGVASVVACLRLEIAIPLPDSDADAAHLLALALCSSFAISVGVSGIVWLFSGQIVNALGQISLKRYLWLLPIGVWLGSSFSALHYWAIRKNRFSIVAKSRLSQAIGGSGTQVIFGVFGFAPVGLLLGHLIFSSFGIWRLARNALKSDGLVFSMIKIARMRVIFNNYKKYPKFSVLEALTNSAGIQLPIMLISSMALGPEVGFLMLATRVMQAPIGLIGGAVSQVYLAQAAERTKDGTLKKLTLDTLDGLIKIGVGGLLFFAIIAPEGFSIFFGHEWVRAGNLVVWMTPWFVFQILSSPISMIMHIQAKQKEMLLLTSVGFVIRIGVVLLAANLNPEFLSEWYAISGALYYFICFFVFAKAAGVAPFQLSQRIFLASPWLIGWIFFAMVCKAVLVILI
jgi:O-antigen/teichoic acid export membrane protein